MKSNICDEMPELISLYLDDELDEVARTRVRRHAVQCTLCGPLFVEMQAVETLFKNAPVKAAPVGFTDRAVEAAFLASFQENLRFGMLTLLFGTIALLTFLVVGSAPTLWGVISTLIAPGAFTGMEQWLPQFVEALQVFGRVFFSAITTLGELLAAPLAVTLVVGLIATYLLTEILKRTRVQMTM